MLILAELVLFDMEDGGVEQSIGEWHRTALASGSMMSG